MYVCSGQIKSSLIKELGDKNWKVRGEALQKVLLILIVFSHFSEFKKYVEYFNYVRRLQIS